mmetsp:Transcript_119042/g.210481  ORF Transcript_119042/g.210481 Transcript_119042/m.210481 type:complete len:345 (-) Transcript_119042:157-1191(-)
MAMIGDEAGSVSDDMCLLCEGTGSLLSDPCPLCEQIAEPTRRRFWCAICRKDLQSAQSLAVHIQGKRHAQLYRMSLPALTEHSLFAQLATGEFRQVIVLTGAGVSTAAGIPDFRSPGGLFEEISATFGSRFPEVLRHGPEELLSRRFARLHPMVWQSEVESFLRSRKYSAAQPTDIHRFCAWLHRQGLLKRVYTQNVDGLHLRPELGLPDNSVVECHGALHDGSIVLYDDPLPKRFDQCCKQDFEAAPAGSEVDLLLVFGTSLRVAPFCTLPNKVPPGCTRVLVNNNMQHCLRYHGSGRSWCEGSASKRWRQLLIESDCDSWVTRFFASPAARERSFCLSGKSC